MVKDYKTLLKERTKKEIKNCRKNIHKYADICSPDKNHKDFWDRCSTCRIEL